MLLFLKIATPFVTCLLGCAIMSRWNRWIVFGLCLAALVMEYALGYMDGLDMVEESPDIDLEE